MSIFEWILITFAYFGVGSVLGHFGWKFGRQKKKSWPTFLLFPTTSIFHNDMPRVVDAYSTPVFYNLTIAFIWPFKLLFSGLGLFVWFFVFSISLFVSAINEFVVVFTNKEEQGVYFSDTLKVFLKPTHS